MKKGFTLIELLIVVAIIGILAAVGAVVIPGILEKTKIAVVKTNHSNIVTYIKAELLNCELGEKKVMISNKFTGLDCEGRHASTIVPAVMNSLAKSFGDNPYGIVHPTPGFTTQAIIDAGGTSTSDDWLGYNILHESSAPNDVDQTIWIISCFKSPCSNNRLRTSIDTSLTKD